MHLHLSCKLGGGSHCTLEGWFHHVLAYKHISEDQASVTVHEMANLSDRPEDENDSLLTFSIHYYLSTFLTLSLL